MKPVQKPGPVKFYTGLAWLGVQTSLWLLLLPWAVLQSLWANKKLRNHQLEMDRKHPRETTTQ